MTFYSRPPLVCRRCGCAAVRWGEYISRDARDGDYGIKHRLETFYGVPHECDRHKLHSAEYERSATSSRNLRPARYQRPERTR